MPTDNPLTKVESRNHIIEKPTVAEKLDEWEVEWEFRLPERTAVYVSTPITTGPLFIDWFRRIGRRLREDDDTYVRAHRSDVILPNTQRTARFVERLRRHHVGIVIDPTAFDVPRWSQATYHIFWTEVIRRHVRRVIFMDGWQYSNGCAREFETAQQLEIDCVDERLYPLSCENGLALLGEASAELQEVELDPSTLDTVIGNLVGPTHRAAAPIQRLLFKDQILDHLASTANVAQFVSFGPGEKLPQRYCRIRGYSANHKFPSVESAIRALLERAPEGMVNIRTFDPERPEGNPFEKCLKGADEVLVKLSKLGVARRLYTIVNETIDESDGGVSGVSHRGVLEFAPDATPRCVDDEEVETVALPFDLGMRVLKSIYGFEPDLRGREGARVEFSIHPRPRGWWHTHTIIWQSEQRPASDLEVRTLWPNRFSRFLGDKAFGLALAAAAGLPVPRTVVFGRRIFPFVFGESMGTSLRWTRTCPEVKSPGFFASAPGWHDPYAVLADPTILEHDASSGDKGPAPVPLVSVIVQEGVRAEFSGRAVIRGKDDTEIHGVPGEGDAFMLGDMGASTLPRHVVQVVQQVVERAYFHFGAVAVEWVFDGHVAWLVQINLQHVDGRSESGGGEIDWVEFRAGKGRIEAFRQTVMSLQGGNKGIVVIGNVSPLSHWGEIAEIYRVPVRFVRE